ncbi:MAG: mobile mystery protein A [Bacteroidetes bacterium]|nr:mobile mystery protein A [Bacteroidota bacterium]
MKQENSRLAIKQIDKKISSIQAFETLHFQKEGWIRTLRNILNMSMEQLGRKMSITAQGVKKMEGREQERGITLKSLDDVAKAMDMKLVYGFIPIDGSLEQLIERKAKEMATRIIMRTSNTMKLENQQNSNEYQKAAIEELADELKRTIPGKLWD